MRTLLVGWTDRPCGRHHMPPSNAGFSTAHQEAQRQWAVEVCRLKNFSCLDCLHKARVPNSGRFLLQHNQVLSSMGNFKTPHRITMTQGSVLRLAEGIHQSILQSKHVVGLDTCADVVNLTQHCGVIHTQASTSGSPDEWVAIVLRYVIVRDQHIARWLSHLKDGVCTSSVCG